MFHECRSQALAHAAATDAVTGIGGTDAAGQEGAALPVSGYEEAGKRGVSGYEEAQWAAADSEMAGPYLMKTEAQMILLIDIFQ